MEKIYNSLEYRTLEKEYQKITNDLKLPFSLASMMQHYAYVYKSITSTEGQNKQDAIGYIDCRINYDLMTMKPTLPDKPLYRIIESNY